MPYVKHRYKVVIERTYNTLKNKIYNNVGELETQYYKTKEPVPYERRTEGEHKKIKIGEKWGDLWDCAWFRFKGQVPESAKGKKTVLIIDVSGEGCVVDNDGNPVRGLTVVEDSFDGRNGLGGKRVLEISECSDGNEKIDIWMDAGCNCLFGTLRNNGCLTAANIATVNVAVRNLFYDFQVLYSLMKALDERSARYNKILFALYDASLMLNEYSNEEIEKASERVARELDKKGGSPSLKFTAIGHAHLDLAWLWPIRETIRKGARTFSTALDLMDKYPDYVFGASQPQLYQWMKQYYPALYKRVKQKVKEGRWEPQGCMWVEADTNLIGGEAMVRQIVYGKKFFRDEFGVDIKHLWMPDVFGYSGALPQILKRSGCDYFMTQKLSWNEHNKFPHQTFMWQGIDGTEIFAHMLPEETYNSPLTPESVHFAEYNYIDSGKCDEALILFGIGDGGGGPGMEHLERAQRLKNLEGLAPVTQGFAEPLFERMAEKSDGLKKWIGELYLEKHQGTYTTQAKNKRFNRKMELALRELEFALVLEGRLSAYPKEELDRIWQEVLLYQFHDIIPGSSIKRVYDESLARYEILYNRVNQLISESYKGIAAGKGAVAFNSLSWDRGEIIRLADKYYSVKIPAMGYAAVKNEITEFSVYTGSGVIENDNLRAVFDDDGAVVSVYDKKNDREILSAPSNIYRVYCDESADCWDIPIEYLDREPEKFILKEQKFFTDGPDAVCSQDYIYNNSSLHVDIKLRHGAKRIEFVTSADWHENLKMLRVSFATNIISDYASYEIQFGKIDRKNNDNTSWENAQFEMCGHKWVDLSEKGYGVALLNDCKYGHRISEGNMDINLLRSQNYPGENADRGKHEFTYAVYPHLGNEAEGEVSKQAYELNVPVRIADGGGDAYCENSLFSITDEVVIESVKKAEESDEVILRIFEPYGKTVKTVLKTGKPCKKIVSCDLTENEEEQLETSENGTELKFRPFEIKTLKLFV